MVYLPFYVTVVGIGFELSLKPTETEFKFRCNFSKPYSEKRNSDTAEVLFISINFVLSQQFYVKLLLVFKFSNKILFPWLGINSTGKSFKSSTFP